MARSTTTARSSRPEPATLACTATVASPTILKIEPGGSYLIESDSGVDNPYGGETEIDNAGTIEKTAGTGTSTILVNGTLSNTGPSRPTRDRSASIRQPFAQVSERHTDRRHLERPRRLDAGVSQRDQHHHQPGEHHPRRQGATIAALRA